MRTHPTALQFPRSRPASFVDPAALDHYLAYLYTPEAQKIIAKNFYRPLDEKAADPADLARFD